MQNKTIIISSSLVLLTALLVYNSSEDTVKDDKKVPKLPTLTTKVQKFQIIKTPTKIEDVYKKEAIEIIRTKQKQEKFQTKYSISILPENMNTDEKKQRFKELLVPAINNVYATLEQQYNEIKKLIDTQTQNDRIQGLMQTYNADNPQDLLRRLKPHPKSIALAQSAMQSGWATSRFTLIANNLFGIWSFDENEPRVQAHETREGRVIYVKRYASLQESIEDYYKLLATSTLFKEFRAQKMKSDDPFILIQSLDKYYKDGDDYTKGLAELIKYNEFNKYDK